MANITRVISPLLNVFVEKCIASKPANEAIRKEIATHGRTLYSQKNSEKETMARAAWIGKNQALAALRKSDQGKAASANPSSNRIKSAFVDARTLRPSDSSTAGAGAIQTSVTPATTRVANAPTGTHANFMSKAQAAPATFAPARPGFYD